MKFKFRLEKILHFLKLRETMKKMEVAALVQKVSLLEAKKNELSQNIRRVLSEQMSKLENGTQWLVYQTKKIEWDSKEIARVERFLKVELQHLEDRKYELNRIVMRIKALESLKDKRYREFKLEQGRKAQKILDNSYQILKGKTG